MKIPTEAQLRQAAKEKVKRNLAYWKPFIMGLAVLNESTIANASPFELLVIDEVLNYREDYLENRVLKAELVERKK